MSEAIAVGAQARLIEGDAYPVEFLSALAQRESWRKEIYRPVYHIHKWWANRLGSIFRGVILGCLLPADADLEQAFYQKRDVSAISVFDPFMGSGTTVGEAHKLGCSALGRDINPVACEGVRVAFGPLERRRLQAAYAQLSTTVGARIRDLYRVQDGSGQPCDVLYFFWVKQVPCPHCSALVDLFSSRVIAQNVYPERKPEMQVCCPKCGDIFPAVGKDQGVSCRACGLHFDAKAGEASGAKATCQTCRRSFAIVEAVRALGRPPSHRLYAKLVLTSEGKKRYLPATPGDVDAYRRCAALLREELQRGAIQLPDGVLTDGYNTRQAINYNYRTWRDFFNERQLLALGWLHAAIAGLADDSTRDALLTLFSGALEFNNVFASYKGEGTGAVRHMFAHHILKPERMPIEANVWGTPKSSGSFSNLFEARLFRALDYRAAPFEVTLEGRGKARSSSAPFSGEVESAWPVDGVLKPRGVYLSCGSSDDTGLPDAVVDFVVTDPPFFDNVHYSELADFFYAWQRLHPRGFVGGQPTTRHPREVQDTDAHNFSAKLEAVFRECHRVLKDHGLLVFTYHHSRPAGWTSLAEAVFGAGFSVVNAHPVKAEMSVATPKSQAKEPIQLDVVLVCRKAKYDARSPMAPSEALAQAVRTARCKLARLASIGLFLSRNDRRVAVVSQFLAALGPVGPEMAVLAMRSQEAALDAAAEARADEPLGTESRVAADAQRTQQLTLPFVVPTDAVDPARSRAAGA